MSPVICIVAKRSRTGPIGGSVAFSLIELIGVLALIVIVVALLLPRLRQSARRAEVAQSAPSGARIADTALACDTMRSALSDHFARYGSFTVDGSVTPPKALTPSPTIANYDQVLLREQLLDKPFEVRIGDGSSRTQVQAVSMAGAGFGSGAGVDGTAGTGFALVAGTANSTVGSVLIEAVISGVSAADARALNDRIDGAALGSGADGADLSGRVKYAAPVNGVTTVYVYLTHR
jgi:type II secretory pathway pseudopilin PulG